MGHHVRHWHMNFHLNSRLAIPDDLFGLVKALCGIEIILTASTGVVAPIPDPALSRSDRCSLCVRIDHGARSSPPTHTSASVGPLLMHWLISSAGTASLRLINDRLSLIMQNPKSPDRVSPALHEPLNPAFRSCCRPSQQV